jgi:hypothetical protein
MLRRGLLVSLVSIGLVSSPVAAAQVDRLPSSIEQGEQIAGNPWIPWLFGLAALSCRSAGKLRRVLVLPGRNACEQSRRQRASGSMATPFTLTS